MPITNNKKLIAVTALYLVTSFVSWLASADETRIGLVGSYLLCASIVLLWTIKSKWTLWVPVVGSAVLVCYFLAADIRLLLKYSSALSTGYLIRSLAFLGLLVLTLLISLIRLRSAPSRNKLGTAAG